MMASTSNNPNFFRSITKEGLFDLYKTSTSPGDSSTLIRIDLKTLSDSIAIYVCNKTRNGNNGEIGLTEKSSSRINVDLFNKEILSSPYAVAVLRHFNDIWNEDLEPIFIHLFKQNLFTLMIDSITKMYTDKKISSDPKLTRSPVIYNESDASLTDSLINNTFWKVYTEGWPSFLSRNISDAHALSSQSVMETLLYYCISIPNIVVNRASNFREQQFKRSEYRSIFLDLLPILIKYSNSGIDKQLQKGFIYPYPIDNQLLDLYQGVDILSSIDDKWEKTIGDIKKSILEKLNNDANIRLYKPSNDPNAMDVTENAASSEIANLFVELHNGYRSIRNKRDFVSEQDDNPNTPIQTMQWPRSIEDLDRVANSRLIDSFSSLSTVLLNNDSIRNFMDDIRNDIESITLDVAEDEYEEDGGEEGEEIMDVDIPKTENQSQHHEPLIVDDEQEKHLAEQEKFLTKGFNVNELRQNLISTSKEKLYMLSARVQNSIIGLVQNSSDPRATDITSLQDLLRKNPPWIKKLKINKLTAEEFFLTIDLTDLYTTWIDLYDKVKDIYRQQILASYSKEGEKITEKETQDLIDETLQTTMKMKHCNDDIANIFLMQELDPTSVLPGIIRVAINNKIDIGDLLRQVNPEISSFVNLKSVPSLIPDQQSNMKLNPIRIQLFVGMIKYILKNHINSSDEDPINLIKMISQCSNLIDNSPLLSIIIKYASLSNPDEAKEVLLNWVTSSKENGLTWDITVALCEVCRSLFTHILNNETASQWLMELHTFDAYTGSADDIRKDSIIQFWKDFKNIQGIAEETTDELKGIEHDFVVQWDYSFDIMHSSDLSVASFLTMQPGVVLDKLLFNGGNKQFGSLLNHAAFRLNLYTNPAFLVYMVKIPRNIRGAFLNDCVTKILKEPESSGEGNTIQTIYQQSKKDIVTEFSRLFYILDIHYSSNNTCLEDITTTGLMDPENGLYTPEIQNILGMPLTSGEKYIRDIITSHINNKNTDISFMMMNVALQNRFKSVLRSQPWMTTVLNRQHRSLAEMSKISPNTTDYSKKKNFKFIAPASTYFNTNAATDENYQMDIINRMQYILLAIWSVTDPLVPVYIDPNFKKPHDASLLFVWNANTNTQLVARSNDVPMIRLENGMEIPSECIEHNDIKNRMFYLCYTGAHDALMDGNMKDLHLQLTDNLMSTSWAEKIPDPYISAFHQFKANLSQFILYGSSFDLCKILVSLFTSYIELSKGDASANLSIAWPLIDKDIFVEQQNVINNKVLSIPSIDPLINILNSDPAKHQGESAIGYKSLVSSSQKPKLICDYYDIANKYSHSLFLDRIHGTYQTQSSYSDMFVSGLKNKKTVDELLTPSDEPFRLGNLKKNVLPHYVVLQMSSLEPSSYDSAVLDKSYRNSRQWITDTIHRSGDLLKQKLPKSVIDSQAQQQEPLFGKPSYAISTPFYTWHKYAHNDVTNLKIERVKLVSTFKSIDIKNEENEGESARKMTSTVKNIIELHQQYYYSNKPHWNDSLKKPWFIHSDNSLRDIFIVYNNNQPSLFLDSRFNRDAIKANVPTSEKEIAFKSLILALELNLRYLALRDINNETTNLKYRKLIPICAMSILRILWRLYSPNIAMAIFSRCIEVNPSITSNTPLEKARGNITVSQLLYNIMVSSLHSEAERVYKYYDDTKTTKYTDQSRLIQYLNIDISNITEIASSNPLSVKPLSAKQLDFIEKMCKDNNLLSSVKDEFPDLHKRSSTSSGANEEVHTRYVLQQFDIYNKTGSISEQDKLTIKDTKDMFTSFIDNLLGSFLTNLQDYNAVKEPEDEDEEAEQETQNDVDIEIRGRYKKSKSSSIVREEKLLDTISIAVKNIKSPIDLYLKLDTVLAIYQKPIKEVILKLKPIMQEVILLLAILQKQ